ncbi:cellulose-binding family II [Plectosphaerella plurivora]|uniref:Cellulose-binding family II n=1 Tax=Plectosphaerella plurivora TaxID=936078 RepID=A0A9P8VJL3_9PEZI|nr:cellulose-binding family II [Plectosphaerella plurivora]
MKSFFSSAAMLALAASVASHDISTSPDQDASVWAALSGQEGTSVARRVTNRPSKRQTGWAPPSNLVTPLKQVWDHQVSTYSQGLYGFKNYGWDQLMAADGTVNLCVRWESGATVTEAQRAQIAEAASRSYAQWFQWLYGFDGFPYTNIPVKITGWAVRDKSLLQGSTAGYDVYTDKDAGGIPQCAESCGRFFNQNGDYSRCAGGASRRYDQTLWLTDGFQGGAGGDWGARVGREYFMGALSSENIHIYQHEIGHTFGLDDFYDWTPSGVTNFVMLAGSAAKITDFDGWMLRNWWYELSRNRSWQGRAAATPAATTKAATPTTTKPAAAAATTSKAAVTTSKAAAPTTTKAAAAATTTKAAATAPTAVSGATAQKWGQCGGQGFTGPTQCAAGLKCNVVNPYYSQCL